MCFPSFIFSYKLFYLIKKKRLELKYLLMKNKMQFLQNTPLETVISSIKYFHTFLNLGKLIRTNVLQRIFLEKTPLHIYFSFIHMSEQNNYILKKIGINIDLFFDLMVYQKFNPKK